MFLQLICSAISCADLSLHTHPFTSAVNIVTAAVAISTEVIIVLNNQVLPSWKSSSRGSIGAKIRTTEKNGLLMFNAGPGVTRCPSYFLASKTSSSSSTSKSSQVAKANMLLNYLWLFYILRRISSHCPCFHAGCIDWGKAAVRACCENFLHFLICIIGSAAEKLGF